MGEQPLPALPLDEWEPTMNTLHLWAQVVGKVRLAATPLRNHWWNVPLYVSARGITTRRMRYDGVTFEIEFDFIDHQLVVRTARGDVERLALRDGLSVAELYRGLFDLLSGLGITVAIRPEPYGVPMTTPFPDDEEHASYNADAVQRFWRILDWTDWVLEEFAGWFCGKTSPVHLFWHSFDLAVTRFSGRRAPALSGADPVTQEAYTHEVVSFGFWSGDRRTGGAAFYSYAAPEPAGLRDEPLRPEQALWTEQNGGSLAILPYDAVRGAAEPEKTLLAFLQGAYDAGAKRAGWDRTDLTTLWSPVAAS